MIATEEGYTEEGYTPNPYQRNRLRKDMEELAELERGYASSDSGLYNPDTKQMVNTDTTPAGRPEETEEVEASEEDVEETSDTPDIELPQKYKKVNWQKRYSDLKRHYDKKLNEFKQMQNTPQYKVPKTPQELEAFKTQYKELYDVVESVAHLSAENKSKELEKNLQSLQGELAKSRQEKAIVELNTKMPDWQAITSSDDFQEWASEQPDEIQRWVFNNPDDASLAIKAIKLYKTEKNISSKNVEDSRQSKPIADAAASISVKQKTSAPKGQKKVWTTSEIAALSLPEYEKLSKQIDKAYQEGRVVKG